MFQVRCLQGDVLSSITLDHGDLLVMDGSAQSEYAHRTVPGLQGPQVNLTYRWLGEGEKKWSSSWVLVLLLLILVSVLLVGTWIDIRMGASLQWSAPIPLGGVLPFPGSCPLGWGDGVGHCHDVASLPGKCLFISPLFL